MLDHAQTACLAPLTRKKRMFHTPKRNAHGSCYIMYAAGDFVNRNTRGTLNEGLCHMCGRIDAVWRSGGVKRNQTHKL